jgi:hypothetical protein
MTAIYVHEAQGFSVSGQRKGCGIADVVKRHLCFCFSTAAKEYASPLTGGREQGEGCIVDRERIRVIINGSLCVPTDGSCWEGRWGCLGDIVKLCTCSMCETVSYTP